MSVVKQKPLKVVMRDIEALQPYEANAKLHPEPQIDHIVASIKEFGFVNPILIDKTDTIIAGHGRLEAAQKSGLLKVPTIQLEHLSLEQAKALRLADNAIPAESGWDADLLEMELASLRTADFDLGPLGLESIQLPEIEEVVTPPPKTPRSKTTLFISVRNEDVVKARKAIAAALDKAKISHNV